MTAFPAGVVYTPYDVEGTCRDSDPRCSAYLSRLLACRDTLPPSVQSKMTEPKLCELASCLVDGTVFEIVKELEEIQQLNERAFLNRRMKVVSAHKAQRGNLAKKHADEVAGSLHKQHNLPLIKARHRAEIDALEKTLAEDMRSTDQKIVTELDQLVFEQQTTLQQAAVPFFSVTEDAQDIQLQICVLDLIQKLAQAKHTY